MPDEVKKLRAVLAVRKRGTGVRYPQHVRAQIAEAAKLLRQRGASWQRVGEVLGIPHETIRRHTEASTSAFVPVVVKADPATAPVLVTPSGYRVEGLSVSALAELLGQLR